MSAASADRCESARWGLGFGIARVGAHGQMVRMGWLRNFGILALSVWMFCAGVLVMLAISDWVDQIPNRTAQYSLAVGIVAIWPWMLAEWPSAHRSHQDALFRWVFWLLTSLVGLGLCRWIWPERFRIGVVTGLCLGWCYACVLRSSTPDPAK